MEKNFQQWAKEKINIEKKDSYKIFCKKREIWMAKIGVNIGNESSKDSPFFRPILILETSMGGDLILGIPLTSQYNEKMNKFLVPISHPKLLKKSFVQLNQVKIFSRKRLERNFDIKISSEELYTIKNRLQEKVLKPRLSEKTHSIVNRISNENLN